MRRLWSDTSEKVWNLPSRHNWMLKAKNWTPRKRSLRKPSMYRQMRYYNYPQALGRSMSSISKGIDQWKRKIRTLEKISLSTFSLLMYIVGSKYLLFNRTKTGTNKEVFATMVDGDRDKIKTLLQQVSTLLARRKNKISPMSNTSTIEGKAILPTSVLRKRSKT